MIRKLLKWFFIVMAVLVVLVGGVVINDFSLWNRALTFPNETEITNSEWYTPKALISGNDTTNYQLADSLSIPTSALIEISQYAENRRSSALLVLHKGKLQLEKRWRGSIKSSTTNSASMAKTIVSILIGIAIEEGAIVSEKESAATYITEWVDDNRKSISIEDLLLMQSGLVVNEDWENPFSDAVQMHLGSETEEVVLGTSLVKPPAEVFEYNNVNSQILGIILERATGEPIETYTSSRLWEPLGAADAGWWMDRKGGIPKTYCCLFAQAKDWASVGQLILQGGKWNDQQIIPKKWLSKLLTPSSIQNNYGYHIWLNENITDDFQAKYSILAGAGNQSVISVPEYELVIVRVGEKPDDWEDSYLVNTLVASLIKQP